MMSKGIFASFARDFIKKVFDIKKKKGACSSFGVGEEVISERLYTVDDKVKAAIDSDAELAKREEEMDNLVVVNDHDEGASNATESSANADGS